MVWSKEAQDREQRLREGGSAAGVLEALVPSNALLNCSKTQRIASRTRRSGFTRSDLHGHIRSQREACTCTRREQPSTPLRSEAGAATSPAPSRR